MGMKSVGTVPSSPKRGGTGTPRTPFPVNYAYEFKFITV